jgi:hypothetical protein
MENENFFEVLLKNYKGDYMLRKNLLIFEQIKYQISKKYTKKIDMSSRIMVNICL